MQRISILLFGFLALSIAAPAAFIVPVSDAVILGNTTAGLNGQIWQNRDSNGSPAAASWTDFAQANAAVNISGRPADFTFTSTGINYGPPTNSSAQTVNSFLGSDSTSLTPAGNGSLELRAVVFALKGYLYVPAAGTYNFTTSSDDGVVLFVGSSGTPVVGFGGVRSGGSETQSITFGAKGYYGMQVRYFNSFDNGAFFNLQSDLSGAAGTLGAPNLFTGTVIPEPASTALAAMGALALAVWMRRKAA